MSETVTVVRTTDSEDETAALGEALGRILRAGDVVALRGDLGAGKTRLVRGIAAGMGLPPERIASPTFVFVHVHEHPTPTDPHACSLVHVDAYRLTDEDQLDSLGWDRLNDGTAAVVVEWAERIENALPPADARADIAIDHTGPSSRRFTITVSREWTSRRGWAAVSIDHPATPGKLPSGWVRCPICAKPVPPDSPTFPFHDEKCRKADLYGWISGKYTISRRFTAEDLDNPDLS